MNNRLDEMAFDMLSHDARGSKDSHLVSFHLIKLEAIQPGQIVLAADSILRQFKEHLEMSLIGNECYLYDRQLEVTQIYDLETCQAVLVHQDGLVASVGLLLLRLLAALHTHVRELDLEVDLIRIATFAEAVVSRLIGERDINLIVSHEFVHLLLDRLHDCPAEDGVFGILVLLDNLAVLVPLQDSQVFL